MVYTGTHERMSATLINRRWQRQFPYAIASMAKDSVLFSSFFVFELLIIMLIIQWMCVSVRQGWETVSVRQKIHLVVFPVKRITLAESKYPRQIYFLAHDVTSDNIYFIFSYKVFLLCVYWFIQRFSYVCVLVWRFSVFHFFWLHFISIHSNNGRYNTYIISRTNVENCK